MAPGLLFKHSFIRKIYLRVHDISKSMVYAENVLSVTQPVNLACQRFIPRNSFAFLITMNKLWYTSTA